MPGNLEENGGVDFTDCEKKGKKNRYSLKKFLHSSRISPSLLRLTRLTKSIDADTDKVHAQPNNSELTKKNTVFNSMAVQQLDLHRPLDRHLPCSVSPELITVPLGSTPTAFAESEPDLEAEHIVEEYEESLSHFADLILESLKNSGQVPAKSLDSTSDLSVSQHLRPNIPRSSPSHVNAPWLLNILSTRTKSDATPPSTITGLHRIQPDPSVEFCNSTGIYNEPCDAKPVRADGSSDPAIIYTLSSLQNQPHGGKVDPEQDAFRNSTDSSPRSSLSNVIQSDTRSLQIQSPAILSGESSVGKLLSTKSAEAVTRPRSTGDRSEGTIHSAGYTSPLVVQQYHQQHYAQKNPGFVDGPRGNSVIVHHPASPFARVPRIPTGEHKCDPTLDNPKCHASPSTSDSTSAIIGSMVRNTEQLPQPNHQSDLKMLAVGSSQAVVKTGGDEPKARPPIIENSLTRKDLSNNRQNVRSNLPDAHPTYEEAWDLKMVRQLGFGISKLTPVPGKPQQANPSLIHDSKIGLRSNTVTTTSGTTVLKAGNSVTESVVGRTAPFSASVKSTPQQVANPSRLDHSAHQCQISPPPEEVGVKLGLPSHENRLFVEQPVQHVEADLNQQGNRQEQTGNNTEYDYAYNGSWSMGVKLNLSLAMSQNNDTSTSSLQRVPCTVSGSVTRPRTTIGPPAVPAHQNKPNTTNGYKPDAGGAGLKSVTHGTGSALIPPEFDSLSTDSCDDSWDKTHGRLVGELTNCRFVDLTTVGLSNRETHTTALQASPNVVLPKTHWSPQADRPRSGIVHQSPVDIRTSQNWTVKAANLQSLPLEEQPWFHPSLTRSKAELLMANEPEGSFLVRNSETCMKDYSLTIRHKTYLHMKISRNTRGQFILGEYSQPYTSVPQMIYHYASTSVPVRGAEYVMLTHPICRKPLPLPQSD